MIGRPPTECAKVLGRTSGEVQHVDGLNVAVFLTGTKEAAVPVSGLVGHFAVVMDEVFNGSPVRRR